jgi:hypothetical protein
MHQHQPRTGPRAIRRVAALGAAALVTVGFTACGPSISGGDGAADSSTLQAPTEESPTGTITIWDRVSSLDFFVSLAFMPLSMAFAGPAGESLGLPMVFLIAGVAPLVIGVVAILAARMRLDEIAHPLDASEQSTDDDLVAQTHQLRTDAPAGELVASAA